MIFSAFCKQFCKNVAAALSSRAIALAMSVFLRLVHRCYALYSSSMFHFILFSITHFFFGSDFGAFDSPV
jgi:hypothetical protein